MSTEQLIAAVLKRVPDADPDTVLDLIVGCDADVEKVFALLGVRSPPKKQMMFRVSKQQLAPRNAARNSVSRQTIHLFSPEQVAAAPIHCSLRYNVLEPSVANQLAASLLKDSRDWVANRFYLYGKIARSHHLNACYGEDPAYIGQFTYQGLPRVVRPSSREIVKAREAIEKIVNEELPQYRSAYHPDRWTSQLAVCNLYRDKTNYISFHSDQMTHLGPEPIIADLSLGCTREFQLKDRLDVQNPTIYSIHAPHNSLIVMHSKCQEEFMHGVPPAKSVNRHPLLDSARICVTFRMYREDFSLQHIPKCDCGRPMVLKTTRKQDYKYIWQCANHYSTNESCNLVREANFDLLKRTEPSA